MQGISYKSGIMKIEDDFMYSPDLPIVFTIDIKKSTTDNYNNTHYNCQLKIGGFEVKYLICGKKKVIGSHSEKGTSITIFGDENDEFIKLIFAIYSKIETVTVGYVENGHLNRQFYAPFNKNGLVYQASNARYKKKLEDAKEEVVDRPIFYGINANIYSVSKKYAKVKILKKIGKKQTTLLKDSDDWHLTPKEVLRYNKIASEFAKSKNKADSIYNAKIFANTYGVDSFKKLVAAAEVATNKKSDDEDIEKAEAFIATYGRFPLMEDIKEVFDHTIGIAIKLKIPYRISDCLIAKNSLTCKFVAEEIIFKESDNTDQAADEFMNQFGDEDDSENDEPKDNLVQAPDF